jgi:hypothetical protein
VLRAAGRTDFDPYAVDAAFPPELDYFVEA